MSGVFIGQGVTGVTGYAFADMRRVTAFSVTGDDYTVAEGVLYSGDGTELICYPGGRVATDFTIPNGVTAVYAAAFLSAWRLQQVESASAVLIVTADGLLYGKNGRTLWMALPQFHQDTLVLAPGGADRRRRVLTESYLAYGVRHGRRVRGAPRSGDCLF